MKRRVLALDGLRGVAILAVMFFHLVQASGGAAGVSLFFVLSGFLITTLLLEEHNRDGVFSLRAFYGRRARRIGPALAVTLVGFLLLNAAVLKWGYGGQPVGNSLFSAGAGAVFLANEAVEYGRQAPGLIHLWSLSLEEQFYAVWPLILLLLLRRRVRPARIGIGLGAAAAAIAVYATLANSLGLSLLPMWVAPLLNAAPILVGCAAAFVVSRIGQLARWARLGTAVAFPAILAWLLIGRPASESTTYGPFANLGFFVVCAFMIICIVVDDRNLAVGRILGSRPLVEIGKVSFGLYLYHALLIRTVWCWVPLPLFAELIALPLAFASFYLYERRFLTSRKPARVEPISESYPTIAADLQPIST